MTKLTDWLTGEQTEISEQWIKVLAQLNFMKLWGG